MQLEAINAGAKNRVAERLHTERIDFPTIPAARARGERLGTNHLVAVRVSDARSESRARVDALLDPEFTVRHVRRSAELQIVRRSVAIRFHLETHPASFRERGETARVVFGKHVRDRPAK